MLWSQQSAKRLPMQSAEDLDLADPLSHIRKQFDLPSDKIYLDGNSLGALSTAVKQALTKTVDQEWGNDLIESWNSHDWIDAPERVGDKIATLIGANHGEVLCCDNLSINLFKCLAAGLEIQAPKTRILVEATHFPTDNYMAQGLSSLLGEERCSVEAVAVDDLLTTDFSDVALLSLSHVDYKTGELRNLPMITAQAQQAGALVIWDLAHSAGVVDVDLNKHNVDMAVGCTYKFLNAGPGAPGYLFVAERHQHAPNSLPGWMGHADRFAFEADYRPADSIRRFLSGTQSVLALSATEAALSLFEQTSIGQIRAKSLALSDYFLSALNEHSATKPISVITPRDHNSRGSQVSLKLDHAFAVSQALIARGVIVDFREPDIVRFGFSPLYTRFDDCHRAVSVLADILDTGVYRESQFKLRKTVT